MVPIDVEYGPWSLPQFDETIIDVVEMVGVTMTLLMYMTPVFYPMSIIPDRPSSA